MSDDFKPFSKAEAEELLAVWEKSNLPIAVPTIRALRTVLALMEELERVAVVVGVSGYQQIRPAECDVLVHQLKTIRDNGSRFYEQLEEANRRLAALRKREKELVEALRDLLSVCRPKPEWGERATPFWQAKLDRASAVLARYQKEEEGKNG